VVLAAGVACMTGCGDDPDTGTLDSWFDDHPFVLDPRSTPGKVVSISPSLATINFVGGQAVFTASGGSGSYTWDLASDSMGSIAPSGSKQAVYTAVAIGDNNVIVYDSNGNAAIARVSGEPAEPLTISADPSATLSTDNAMTVLTVSGGQPTYTWSVADPGRGNFTGSKEGTSVVYRRYRSGDNAVTVKDGLGNTASLVIEQP